MPHGADHFQPEIKYPLQCFGCLRRGDYDTFGLPIKCPDCGSLEIHDPTGPNVKPKGRIFNAADCESCVANKGKIAPPHESSRRCQSGGHTHCSCDVCF